MNKRLKTRSVQVVVPVIGAALIILTAVCCYHTVRETIVENEKQSLTSIAGVSAHSLETSLKAKSNLVYAALSGDMASEEDIRQNMLKTGEKSRYIHLDEVSGLKKWEKDACEEAKASPGEVAAGPVLHKAEGYYAFYLTKAVYMEKSIAGYVQVELNLDEVYEEEQALSSLTIGNQGYCIVKNREGSTIMANKDIREEEISFSYEEDANCQIVWTYRVDSGTPERIRKLAAYDTAEFGGEQFILCIVENYDGIVAPIERIALYLSLLGAVLLLWLGFFAYKIMLKQREEEQLKLELQHEKELNEANEALKNQENLMQKYNHSKTNAVLTGAIAHEFNNLMTPIVLYSELFSENESVRREMPEEAEELSLAVKRCEELARQLLDYSRQGRAEKVLVEYNATFAVENSISMAERLLPDNIKMEAAVCRTKYYLKGQIGSLNQIIFNLVTNGIHAIDGKAGIINIQFGLSNEDERMVRLVVTDNGSGIPVEIRQRIFEPFFSTKGEKSGMGIGLTVVKRLVEEHGGMIRVKSEAGDGTSFIMDFPWIKK